ncbi:hypothetical protein MTO96_022721 [Rhipicephalus appendiculatus]
MVHLTFLKIIGAEETFQFVYFSSVIAMYLVYPTSSTTRMEPFFTTPFRSDVLGSTVLQGEIERCTGYAEREEVLRRLYNRETNVVLVSFQSRWDEDDLAWSRLLKYRKTSWHFSNDGLGRFLRANAREGRQSLVIVPSLKIDLKQFLKFVNYSLAYHIAAYWVLVRDDAVMNEEMTLYAKISPPAKVSILGHCKHGLGSALLYSDRSRSPVLFSASELVERGSLVDVTWRPGQQGFTEEDLVVVCLHVLINEEYAGQKIARMQSLCNEARNVYLRLFLTQKNVSLIYAHYVNVYNATSFMIGGQADLLLSPTNLDSIVVDVFSFADTNLHHDTFYALANDTRSVSVFAVLSDSTWGVALTLLSLLMCTLTLTSLNSAGNIKAFLQSTTRETLFLQMTALVTATKPADHLDTLEELEDAVDAGRVAPVVAQNTWTYANLKAGADHPYSLLRKLSAVYKQHLGEQLLVPTPADCILTAGRRDRVCYSHVLPRCALQGFAPGIEPFQEPIMMMPDGIPLRHGFAYLPALRKLFLAVREGSLIRDVDVTCETNPSTSNELSVELGEFMKHYIFLQLVAVVVFTAECLTGLFLKVRHALYEQNVSF